MVKFIYYLMMCFTALLYCCGERNTPPEKTNSNNIPDTTMFNSTPATVLQKSEQQIFDTLTHTFQYIIENNKQWSMEKKERYKQFEIWLLQDVKRQKQLTDHFKYLYTVLKNSKPQSANNITIKQLIKNTIECVTSDTCKNRNDVYLYDTGDY